MDMDYLQALKRPSLTVVLDETPYAVQKASLLRFFELHAALRSIDGDDGERIARYLACALGVPVELARSWFFVEAIDAYQAITSLNEPMRIHMDIAPTRQAGSPSGSSDLPKLTSPPQEKPFQYDGRALAQIVTTLAQAFGWPRDFILNELTYDEARCYLQEIALRDHDQHERIYRLSDVAYDNSGKLRPFPPPPFPPTLIEALPSTEEAPRVRVPSPGVIGTTISLEEEYLYHG